MKTKTSHNDRKSHRQTPRRGRTNPSRQKFESVGEWEAEVEATSRGPTRADTKRKVRTKDNIKKIDVFDILDKARLLLRKGYEVRLCSKSDGEAIRLYPCVDSNYKKMFVSSMTMGSFRTAIGDIPFRIKRCGKTVDPEQEVAEKLRKAETIREARRVNVTPDTVVTCPNCGTEFRVGKELA